jgi:hypothetical protein
MVSRRQGKFLYGNRYVELCKSATDVTMQNITPEIKTSQFTLCDQIGQRLLRHAMANVSLCGVHSAGGTYFVSLCEWQLFALPTSVVMHSGAVNTL